jgi:hypothetical protein
MRAAALRRPPMSDETRAKIIARVRSPEMRERSRLAATGKPVSAQTRAKISMANRGRPLSVEHRAKISAAQKGRIISAESLAKMRATKQRNPSNGRSTRNHDVVAFGETKHLAAWARDPRCVVAYHCLKKRLRRGWSSERAITAPG